MLEKPKVETIRATVDGGSGVYSFYFPECINADNTVKWFKETTDIMIQYGYLVYPHSDKHLDESGKAYPYRFQYANEVIPVIDAWLAYLMDETHEKWAEATKEFVNGYRDTKNRGYSKEEIEKLKAENNRLKARLSRAKRNHEKIQKWCFMWAGTKDKYSKFIH